MPIVDTRYVSALKVLLYPNLKSKNFKFIIYEIALNMLRTPGKVIEFDSKFNFNISNYFSDLNISRHWIIVFISNILDDKSKVNSLNLTN